MLGRRYADFDKHFLIKMFNLEKSLTDSFSLL